MEQKESVVHSFDGKPAPEAIPLAKKGEKIMSRKNVIIFIAVLVLGILTGFGITKFTKSSSMQVSSGTNVAKLPQGTIFGSDAKNFKDTAEGILKKGGIEGEGAYHLERPGGSSQNVYLTSSVLDLSQLVNRKIKVWGETNAAQKAGWLMDVGRAQIIK
jgi:hypothetical protein